MASQRRKCTGHKSNGKPCEAWAIKGGFVCATHGGQAPQTQKAAERRLALEAAGRMVERDGVDKDPLEHLLDSLHQAAQLAAVWGLMVAALDNAGEEEADLNGTLRGELGYMEVTDDDALATGELRVMSNERLLALNSQGMAQVHPFVDRFERAVERRAKLAKMCVDAGVEQKLVALAERRADLVADIFRKVFDDPELGLSAAKKRAATIVAARHLRLIAGDAA